MPLVQISPVPKLQFLDVSGRPLSGGKIYTYAAGGTTPLASYTDTTGATPNANPVILDSGGFASIWLGFSAYKLKVTDSSDVQQYVIDGMNPGALGNIAITGTLSVSGAATLSSTLGVTGAATLSSTLGVTGKITATGGIVGVTDASDAAAGNIGEFMQAKQVTPQSLTTATTINLVSIALTAGDWDLSGVVGFTGNSTTLTGELIAISSTSLNFVPNDGSEENSSTQRFTTLAAGFFTIPLPPFRVSISSPTTYYLVVQAVFGSGTCLAQGMIRARRIR